MIKFAPMRSISLVALLVLLVWSALLAPLQFIQQQQEHRAYMQRDSDEETFQLRLTKQALRTAANRPQFFNDHEILFEGKRYDVVSIKNEWNVLVFTCRIDTVENEFEERFAQLTQEKTSHKHKAIKLQKLVDDYVLGTTVAFELYELPGIKNCIPNGCTPESIPTSISPPPKLG